MHGKKNLFIKEFCPDLQAATGSSAAEEQSLVAVLVLVKSLSCVLSLTVPYKSELS